MTGPAEAAGGDHGLSQQQKATIDQLNTPLSVSRQPQGALTQVGQSEAKILSSGVASTAQAAASSARLSLYRGSFLMWARDTMTWYYNGSTVTSSSLGQEAGYVFPNTSQAKGVSRYYSSTSEHAWRGKYTIGAGVVTPWGAVSVYAMDYSTDWHVYRNGAGNGRWN